MSYSTITKCRVCGSTDLLEVLDLGFQPLANSLRRNVMDSEDRYPLTLLFCQDCSLVQLKETVDKQALFSRYVWVTGTSSTARNFAEKFCTSVCDSANLRKGDLVVEIASNDGTFLAPFKDRGFHVLGIDPAENIAAIANERGIETQTAFWDEETAREVVSACGNPRLVFARNVIAHVSELTSVLKGINLCLDDEGTAVIEIHYAGKILSDLQYDAIYHEHLCYFSATTLGCLLAWHGLHAIDVDQGPISGGSLILICSKRKPRNLTPYDALVANENNKGVNAELEWVKFGRRCQTHRDESRELVAQHAGKIMVGFGASARSSTFLNFCGFKHPGIAAIIDNNPIKQGCFSPGSHIPIVSMSEGLGLSPGLIFLLGWNFRDEIIADCRMHGYKGNFLAPFPNQPYFVT